MSLLGRFNGVLITVIVIATGRLVTSDSFIKTMSVSQAGPNQSEQLPSRSVNGMSWSDDGQFLLSRSRGDRSADVLITLHDTRYPNRPSWKLDNLYGRSTNDSALSPDARHVLLANDGGDLWRVDVKTHEVTEIAKRKQSVFVASAISNKGNMFAGVTAHSELCFYDDSTKNLRFNSSQCISHISRLQFSVDDRRFLVSCVDGSILIWEVASGEIIRKFKGHGRAVAAFVGDGSQVATLDEAGTIQIHDVATGEAIWRETNALRDNFRIPYLDASKNGSILAWTVEHNRLVIHHRHLVKKRIEILNPSLIMNIRFSPDGSTLAVAGLEATIRLYDTTTGRETVRIDTTPSNEF